MSDPLAVRHFLSGAELDRATLARLLERALELKAAPLSSAALSERAIALIFERPSTRTRVSFEVGIFELGGHPALLRGDELQLVRGEAVRDTALVLSRQVAAIGLRSGSDEILEELAAYASVPVFNMLTPREHPCQALADLLTIKEAYGRLEGLRITYVGDSNNVARSLVRLGSLAGMEVVLSSPPGYAFTGQEVAQLSGGAIERSTQGERGDLFIAPRLIADPHAAAQGAHVLYTDVWVSMGDEQSAEQRRSALAPYRIDDALLDCAAEEAFALHCLPAHPGEEISAEVLYGSRQRIWEQAENRRHAQKALLEWLVGALP